MQPVARSQDFQGHFHNLAFFSSIDSELDRHPQTSGRIILKKSVEN